MFSRCHRFDVFDAWFDVIDSPHCVMMIRYYHQAYDALRLMPTTPVNLVEIKELAYLINFKVRQQIRKFVCVGCHSLHFVFAFPFSNELFIFQLVRLLLSASKHSEAVDQFQAHIIVWRTRIYATTSIGSANVIVASPTSSAAAAAAAGASGPGVGVPPRGGATNLSNSGPLAFMHWTWMTRQYEQLYFLLAHLEI